MTTSPTIGIQKIQAPGREGIAMTLNFKRIVTTHNTKQIHQVAAFGGLSFITGPPTVQRPARLSFSLPGSLETTALCITEPQL